MKLKEGFITHETGTEHITVTAGDTAFNGIIRSNQTAGFIVECLKDDVTKEQIVDRMLERYDAPRDRISEDVDRIIAVLQKIGAIDD